MNNQFATPEISLKLKELGFDEKCFLFYWSGSNKPMGNHSEPKTNTELIRLSETKLQGLKDGQFYSLPLWQQAIDFCLKKLESYNPEPYNRRWSIEYYANGDGGIDFGEGDYFYEFKTLEDAILKLIELINKRL